MEKRNWYWYILNFPGAVYVKGLFVAVAINSIAVVIGVVVLLLCAIPSFRKGFNPLSKLSRA